MSSGKRRETLASLEDFDKRFFPRPAEDESNEPQQDDPEIRAERIVTEALLALRQ